MLVRLEQLIDDRPLRVGEEVEVELLVAFVVRERVDDRRVLSRSCTNNGNVGTSNDNRSAFPVQLRKGRESAFNLGGGVLRRAQLRRVKNLPNQRLPSLAR